MTEHKTPPEPLSEAALDQIHGGGVSGTGGQSDTTNDTGNARVLAHRNDYLSTRQTPVSAPDD